MKTKPYYFTRQTPNGLVEDDIVTPSSESVLDEAEKHGITFRTIPGTKIIELSYQGKLQYFKAQIPFETTYIGSYLGTDKAAGRAAMIDQGISVSPGFAILPTDKPEYWEEVFHALKKPLVVKPSNLNQGRSVFMEVEFLPEFMDIMGRCMAALEGDEASVIVEEMFDGNEYRITATPEKVIGVMYRRPANVVGDGRSTVQELINQKNSDPLRGDSPNDILVKIKIDEHVTTYLREQGKSLSDVPKVDERIFLRQNSNISTGGDSIDMTDIAHPSVLEIALRAMKAFPGLAIGGIDLMTKDITQPQTPETYCILEINKSPGFSIHDHPYEGVSRNAAREFLYILYPELRTEV